MKSDIAVTVWHPGDANALAQLRDVLALGKKHSSTLGFLTNSAYTDRARRDGLLMAHEGATLVGYCLFDVHRAGHIKLVHVCVDTATRGSGVGKQLIDRAQALNPAANGILADCRRDYAAMDRFWKSVGMHPAGERAGRSSKGSVLTRWWRQLGELDLLEGAAVDTAAPLVVLDSNVIADLYGLPATFRADRDASRGLLADWLDAAVVFAMSVQALHEINGISDEPERRAQQQGSSGLVRLRTSRPDDQKVETGLISLIGEDAIRRDRSLSNDVDHLADAIRAGADYFVTNDGALIAAVEDWIENEHSMRVVRPHVLIGHIQATLDRPAYEPRLIESIDLNWKLGNELPLRDLELAFLTYPDEKPNEFARSLRAALSHFPSTKSLVLIEEGGTPQALICTSARDDRLEVSMFRTARGQRSTTLALQLARYVRRMAAEGGLAGVDITDQKLSGPASEALIMDRYQSTPRGISADVVLRPTSISQTVTSLAPATLDRPCDIAELERQLWPLTILESDMRAFIVPIQPRHAERLFGFSPGSLFHVRRLNLGLSREHVYFHAGHALPETPARLIWYVTGDKTNEVRQIAGHSRLVESTLLSPEQAHRQFGHLGVLRLRDIRSVARKDGRVHVMRFEDTQLFEAPLSRSQLRPLFSAHSVREPIQSTREVPTTLFDDIVRSAWG